MGPHQHQGIHRLVYLENARRMLYATPGKLRDMNQPFQTTQVNKHAEVGYIRHFTVDNFAWFQRVEELAAASLPG